MITLAFSKDIFSQDFDLNVILYIAAIEIVLECGLFVIGVAALWYL